MKCLDSTAAAAAADKKFYFTWLLMNGHRMQQQQRYSSRRNVLIQMNSLNFTKNSGSISVDNNEMFSVYNATLIMLL